MKLLKNKKFYGIVLLLAVLFFAWRGYTFLAIRCGMDRALDQAAEIRMECMGDGLILNADNDLFPAVKTAVQGIEPRFSIVNPFCYYGTNGLLYTLTIRTEDMVFTVDLIASDRDRCLIKSGHLLCEADTNGLFQLFHEVKIFHLFVLT